MASMATPGGPPSARWLLVDEASRAVADLGPVHPCPAIADKFLFDLGSGCHERLAAQKIPYGAKHALGLIKQMYVWDIGTRSGVIDFRGGELT